MFRLYHYLISKICTIRGYFFSLRLLYLVVTHAHVVTNTLGSVLPL
nr:MAG TPA: hypothetical protein [Inoviridae sp.]